MLSVFPKVKEALTAAALLDTCAHVLQCWAHTTAGESMLKLHLPFLHMLLVKGVIRGSVVSVWSQGNWLEVGHAEAVRKRPGSVEGHHRHHWKGQGLQQDSHQNLISSSSFHLCLPGTTNWWHSCPLQGELCNLWVFFVQILLFEGNPLSLNPNSLQIICCRYWYV